MTEEYPFWNVGSAYRVPLQSSDDGQEVWIDRDRMMGLSPALDHLLSGGLTITGSPDWPALCVFPKEVWSDLQPKLLQLPSMNKGAREVQRKMIGMAQSFGETGPLSISVEQMGHAEIRRDAILIVFENGSAEIWGAECLDGKASEWVRSCSAAAA